ncbi:VWA domain-containing protein [candidate division KSB1 bacterium]|nr:VWA domain-containing protein [candidate division KSB1 bacterium]MBL7092358.1 VWA domain-containing protein [candidate division KSB1 bacterium]
MLRFHDPEFLILLLVVPFLIYWYIRRHTKASGTMRFSNLGNIKNIRSTPSKKYRHVLFLFRLFAVILLIIAFARPQSGTKEEQIITEGIDIIMAMDISSSMLAEDLARHKNRLDVTKEVAGQFISERTNDRIGMVVFSAKSYTQCPLTLDYGILLKFLQEIHIGMIEDGTAIGMAVANCVNRLRSSKAKSKVVILLTDGRNNRGELDPVTAAQIAKTMKVRIYTIGAGKHGEALYPIDDPFLGKRYVPMKVDIDEDVLKKIASTTGGRYFRATDKTSLQKIYQEIGELEKTKIEVKEFTRYSELFVNFLLAALGLLLLEVILANTRFRKIP